MIKGQVTLNAVSLVNTGAITVNTAGSLTVNSAFTCGATSTLAVNGYFAIASPVPIFLACSATGTGTLATYSQLNISSTFGVANIRSLSPLAALSIIQLSFTKIRSVGCKHIFCSQSASHPFRTDPQLLLHCWIEHPERWFACNRSRTVSDVRS